MRSQGGAGRSHWASADFPDASSPDFRPIAAVGGQRRVTAGQATPTAGGVHPAPCMRKWGPGGRRRAIAASNSVESLALMNTAPFRRAGTVRPSGDAEILQAEAGTAGWRRRNHTCCGRLRDRWPVGARHDTDRGRAAAYGASGRRVSTGRARSCDDGQAGTQPYRPDAGSSGIGRRTAARRRRHQPRLRRRPRRRRPVLSRARRLRPLRQAPSPP